MPREERREAMYRRRDTNKSLLRATEKLRVDEDERRIYDVFPLNL